VPCQALVLLLALIPAVGVLLRVPAFHGPSYWRWGFLDYPLLPFLVCSLVAGALLLLAYRRRSVVLLALTQLFLLVSYSSQVKDPLHKIDWCIRDPRIGSYYTEAARIRGFSTWMSRFVEMQPEMAMHAKTHPPGPIIYYYFFVRLFGSQSAALAGAFVLGLLVCLGAPGLYLLTRQITADPDAAWLAGAAWAVLPAHVVIFPDLDVLYPLFTIGMLYCWMRALQSGQVGWAVAVGVIAFGALMMTHAFVVLAAFFVLSALLAARYRPAFSGLAVLGSLFLLLYAVFGYNHWAELSSAVRSQNKFASGWFIRPYHLTIFWDLYDFFLAAGWVPLGILIMGLGRWRRCWATLPASLRMFLPAALLGLLSVDVSGALRAETARVWMFLQPLVIPLVGVELRNWSPRWQATTFGVWLLILAVIRSRMDFVW
jgi:hypothetical protein